MNRLALQLQRYDFIEQHANLSNKAVNDLELERLMVKARSDYYHNRRFASIIKLLKYIKYDFVLILFEMILFSVPKSAVNKILKLIK